MEHKGAFFFIILSHVGNSEVVYGSDGEAVALHELEKYFHARRCPSLAGKPKVLVIDACRGNTREAHHVGISTRFSHKFSKVVNNMSNKVSMTTSSADIMTIFLSRAPGRIASSKETERSVFIELFAIDIKGASINDNLAKIIMNVQQKLRRPTMQYKCTFGKCYYIKRFVLLQCLLLLLLLLLLLF